MKRIFTLAVCAIMLTALNAGAWDLKEALKGIGGDGGSAIESALGGLLSTDKITVSSLTGTWSYSAPAVTFKSDNVLKKAGGAAASAMIVEKLTPIYQRTGFDKAVLTINEDSTFVLTANKIKLSGTVAELTSDSGSQANFVFNFAVAGKLNIGKVDAYVTKSALGSMSVMFDVSRLITIMETVSKFAGNSTIKTTVDLLKSYDGLCAGFEMKKSK